MPGNRGAGDPDTNRTKLHFLTMNKKTIITLVRRDGSTLTETVDADLVNSTWLKWYTLLMFSIPNFDSSELSPAFGPGSEKF
jgi:hypothetical protein